MLLSIYPDGAFALTTHEDIDGPHVETGFGRCVEDIVTMDILNALVAFTNFVFVPALAYGAQLAIGALGVTLIYGILRFSNFAHGDTMAFGTMIAILFTWWFQSMGISFGPLPTALLALPFGIALTAAFVLATDRVVYRFYRKQRRQHVDPGDRVAGRDVRDERDHPLHHRGGRAELRGWRAVR